MVNLEILLSFSVYYLLHSYITNIKNYYVIICVIVVLVIIFGGTLNSYFTSAIFDPKTKKYYNDFISSETSGSVLFPKNMF